MTKPPSKIVIATPHPRYDALVERLGARAGLSVVRIDAFGDLSAERLARIAPDYVFLPHWSWRIPAEVYDAFSCVVFHMTDLPYGRGGSPLQNLILKGHQETQLSALRCVRELDAGPIYMKKTLSLLGSAEEIFLRARSLMEDMILTIAIDRPEPIPQRGEPTFFARLGPEAGDLTKAETVSAAYDRIRMLDAAGYPPAHIDCGSFRFEFNRANITPDGLLAQVRIRIKEES